MQINILLAEDNEYTAKQYKLALEKKGHQVTLTKDGVECIDLYKDEAKYSELFKKIGCRRLVSSCFMQISPKLDFLATKITQCCLKRFSERFGSVNLVTQI